MAMVLTKQILVQYVMDAINCEREEAKSLVCGFFNVIAEALVRGNEVKLSGIGNFRVRSKRARPGRNPRTGEPAQISARRVVTFLAGQKLKHAVQKALLSVDNPV